MTRAVTGRGPRLRTGWPSPVPLWALGRPQVDDTGDANVRPDPVGGVWRHPDNRLADQRPALVAAGYQGAITRAAAIKQVWPSRMVSIRRVFLPRDGPADYALPESRRMSRSPRPERSIRLTFLVAHLLVARTDTPRGSGKCASGWRGAFQNHDPVRCCGKRTGNPHRMAGEQDDCSVASTRPVPSWLRTRAGRYVIVVVLVCTAAYLLDSILPYPSSRPVTILEGVLGAIVAIPLLSILVLFTLSAVFIAFGEGGIFDPVVEILSKRPTAISGPRQLIAQGVTCDLTISLVFGFGAGLLPGLLVGLSLGSAFGLISWLATWLAMSAAWGASSPWLRYFVAVRILARRCQIPVDLGRFLDWAYA